MTDWSQAACLHADPDMWHPLRGESAWPAKLICRTACPIMRDCRAFGLAVSVAVYQGVYGGLSERERREIRAGETSVGEVDARDAEVMSAGGQRAFAGLRDGAVRRRQREGCGEPSGSARSHRRLEPCGTHAAFNRHRQRGEEPCEACWEAERVFQREAKRRQQRKGAA